MPLMQEQLLIKLCLFYSRRGWTLAAAGRTHDEHGATRGCAGPAGAPHSTPPLRYPLRQQPRPGKPLGSAELIMYMSYTTIVCILFKLITSYIVLWEEYSV